MPFQAKIATHSYILLYSLYNGSQKVPFSHPGQVDFPAWQVLVTFHSHLPDGLVLYQLINEKEQPDLPRASTI